MYVPPAVTLRTLHFLRLWGYVFRVILTVNTDSSCFPGGLSNRQGLVQCEMHVAFSFYVELPMSGNYFMKTTAFSDKPFVIHSKNSHQELCQTHLHDFKNKAVARVKLKQTYLSTSS
jgi:hypothetical protein